MVYFVMVFVPRLWDKKRTLFDEFSWCAGIAEHLCSFVSTGGTTVHWHSEKASIQSLFLPHTPAEWETSDLSLLYYPDAPAPLGNEISYYVYHAKPSSAGLKKPMGRRQSLPWPWQSREALGERCARGCNGYRVISHLLQLGSWSASDWRCKPGGGPPACEQHSWISGNTGNKKLILVWLWQTLLSNKRIFIQLPQANPGSEGTFWTTCPCPNQQLWMHNKAVLCDLDCSRFTQRQEHPPALLLSTSYTTQTDN